MSTLARAPDVEQRQRIFRALETRNRIVGVLRLAVPAAGVVIFGGLVLQLFVSGLGHDFGFANVYVDRNQLVVDTPSYASTGADGSTYRIEARSASAALDRADIIAIDGLMLTIEKPSGDTLSARAEDARLALTSQVVTIAGELRISDSGGMQGTATGIVADLAAETMVGHSQVNLSFANGAILTAARMGYDGGTSTWRFDRVKLSLPATPGASGTVAPPAGAGS